MADNREYRQAILSSAETILGFARGRRMERNQEVAEAMAVLEKAIAAARLHKATHADIQAVVTATSELSRLLRNARL